jgi:toxin ParE1/3/4
MYTVRLTAAADFELAQAIRWYNSEREGVGDRLLADVENKLLSIATHPGRFPFARGDIRRAKLRRFPYNMFFRQVETTIYIIACFHNSRDPEAWIVRT